MRNVRVAPLPIFAVLLAVCSAVSGQSVRSTRSGLLYFFDGYVFIGDEQLQQKFGRFPEIGQGKILRTELGRAEVLLTPGVVLRVDENSAVKMVSDSLTDTRVELLHGSAIIEVSHEATNPTDTLIYKNWQVRVPQDSVARINSDPSQIRVLSGKATVSTDGVSAVATVQRGEVLPFASVLVAEQATIPASDDFNLWAMNRSSVVSEDNTIGAGITDDPDQVDTSGVALGNFSYFPSTGIPSLGIAYPYGLSFWSPYQSVNPWFNPYLSVYPYGLLYRRAPTATFLNPRMNYPRPIGISSGNTTIGRPVVPSFPRIPQPLPRPSVPPARVIPPRVIHR